MGRLKYIALYMRLIEITFNFPSTYEGESEMTMVRLPLRGAQAFIDALINQFRNAVNGEVTKEGE